MNGPVIETKQIECCAMKCNEKLWVKHDTFGPWFCDDDCFVDYIGENVDVRVDREDDLC